MVCEQLFTSYPLITNSADKASFPFCSSAGLPVQDSMPWPWNKSHNAKNVGESSSRRASPNASSKESTRQEDDADQAAQSAEAHLQHLYAFPHMLMPKGNRRQRIRDKLSAHDGTTDDSFFSQGDETVLPAIRSHKPSLISQTHKNPPPKSPVRELNSWPSHCPAPRGNVDDRVLISSFLRRLSFDV